MLKIGEIQVTTGHSIYLPEKWHDILSAFSKNANCPYSYVIADSVKKGKSKYYICTSEEKQKGKSLRLAFSEYVIRYLLAEEVPDTNIGFSFKEYLPDVGTYVLLTNPKVPDDVVSGVFKVDVELLDENLITFTFKIEDPFGKTFTDVNYYDGVKKCTWKFLYGDDSYMTDYEKMFKDTIIHKNFVIQSAEKLARYLESQKAIGHAEALRKRAIVHDISKLTYDDELRALSRIINDKSSLQDSSKQLSPIKKDAIELHWKHNTHHPEHFTSPLDMSKLDIMEMCCDWHARSSQYQTDLLEFVQQQQDMRFHFPDWMFAEIMHYCKVLASEY